MRRKILVPSIISALLSIIAIFPINEYGYYVFLRWAICGSASFVALIFFKNAKSGFAWITVLLAIVFNPFVPVYLNKGTWKIIDVVAAIIFWLSIIFAKGKKEGEGK